jgi:hypothetical protein
MACCPERTIGSLETGDFSSSLTTKRNNYAVNCGYKGVATRYPTKCDNRCNPLPLPTVDAVPSGTYLENKVASCKVTYIRNSAVSSQQHTRDLQLATIECGEKFGHYTRKIVLPCPGDPPEYKNSTLPKPSFNVCQPPRQ